MNAPSIDQVVAFLEQTALFRGCATETLSRVAPHLEHRVFAPGDLLASIGGPPVGLGILAAGRASVRLAGSDTAVDEVAPGDVYGEVALLLGVANPMAVVAEEECRVLILSKAHFERVIGALPTVAAAIARRLAQRVSRIGAVATRAARASGSSPALPVRGVSSSSSPELIVAGRRAEIRFVEVGDFQITATLLETVPVKLMLLHRMLPLELKGRVLLVGMVNPRSLEAQQELRRMLHNVEPEIVAIAQEDFNQAVLRLKLDVAERALSPSQQRAAVAQRFVYHTETKKESEKALAIGDEVINLFDRILAEGLERGASDVHIEPEVSGVRVRYRVQGVLHDRKDPVPPTFAAPLLARIKVLAEMDITERRLPQDGRIGALVARRELNFRVSTLAAARGEKVVIRIIDPTAVMRPLDQIYFDEHIVETVRHQLAAPHGAIVVAGPTGSGKSSTLYSMLNTRRMGRPDNNLVTVEDPIEFLFPGVTQVAVNTRVKLDYPDVLRAMLRQDPDVIMIGELRDAATAAIIVEASLTGHLVMTSMHASTAVAVLQRLGHLGVEPQLTAQALNLIIVQRLARRLCPTCAREDDVPPVLLESLVARGVVPRGVGRLPRPVGCEHCDRTGYRGRVAVVEMLALTDELRNLLTAGRNPSEILTKATDGKSFVSFARYSALLMARKLLAPADALLVVST